MSEGRKKIEKNKKMLKWFKDDHESIPDEWKNKNIHYRRNNNWVIRFLLVLKRLGNPLSKDLVKHICCEYLVFRCRKYVEYHFHTTYVDGRLSEHKTAIFRHVMDKKVTIVHSPLKHKGKTDNFIFNVCKSFLYCGQRVKIVCASGSETKFDKIEDVINSLGWETSYEYKSSNPEYGYALGDNKFTWEIARPKVQRNYGYVNAKDTFLVLYGLGLCDNQDGMRYFANNVSYNGLLIVDFV